MIIDCISDLHGYYPELDGGDLLIVAGDFTARDTLTELSKFKDWLSVQKYKKIITVAGNHDNLIEQRIGIGDEDSWDSEFLSYLEDSGTEFCGLKIWGSPWTTKFPGINPHCCAFTVDKDEELQEKYDLIPNDTDILITHNPPYGILDKTSRGECVGSKNLQMQLYTRLRPKLFICGHIHEAYGQEPPGGFIEIAVNASHVNERYEPVNKPIRIILNNDHGG